MRKRGKRTEEHQCCLDSATCQAVRDMRKGDRAEVVRLFGDLNSIYRREDGLLEVCVMHVEGVELRQIVIVTDSDMTDWAGIVSGIVDRGRGKLLLVEEYRTTLTANMPIAVKCSDEFVDYTGGESRFCELVLHHPGAHRQGSVQWIKSHTGQRRRLRCGKLYVENHLRCQRDPDHDSAHVAKDLGGVVHRWL